MITEVEDYFAKGCGRCARFETADCSALLWAEGLAVLRALCLELGLEEVVRWGHPTYRHAGRNILVFGAFRDDFRLSFFNAGLMTDPSGVLERVGPNSQDDGTLRFTEAGAVAQLDAVLRAYVREAMDYAEQGRTAPKTQRQLEMPEEWIDALDADPELAEAFFELTPGRQRSYLFNLSTAKQPSTRIARIEKFRPKIISGKGAQER